MWLANKFAFFLAVAVLSQNAPGFGFAREGRYAVRNIRHTSWTSENGVSAVFEIQQDSSGYLWLNTANGVVRFDGVRFQSLEEATNKALLSSDITTAYIAPSGRIWFTPRTTGLILLENDHARVYSSDRRCISVAENGGMAEDPDGSLWIKALSGLYHLRGLSCDQITEADGYPGGLPAAILVDRQGTIWVKAPSGELVFRRKNKSKFELSQYVSSPTSRPAFLHEGPDGSIWLSDEGGLRRLSQTGRQTAITGRMPAAGFGDFAFGRDGSLWAVINRGISRFDKTTWGPKGTVSAGDADNTSRFEELSSNAIWNLKVDREDTIWIGTNSGLDSVRVTAFKTILLPAEEHEFGLAVGDNGSVWTGNASLPLTRLYPDGRFIRFEKPHNVICVRRAHNGTIWSASQGPNKLWRSTPKDFRRVQYPNEDVTHVVSLAVDRNNEPWISTRPGMTFHLSHGTWANETQTIGRSIGNLGAMIGAEDGMVWIAYGTGHTGNRAGWLLGWDGRAFQRYSFVDGHLDISVRTMAARGDHVWLAGAGGIVLFTHGSFYLMEFIDRNLPGRVSGIFETETGELWANSFTGITHVSAAELCRWINSPTSKIAGEHLDAFDGLPGLSAERFPEPSVIQGSDRRMWFATMKGIAWFDENSFARIHNSIPPPVFVTAIIANGTLYAGASGVPLPKQTQNLEIDYTALSLAVPERVRFRYRLDGVDTEWQEPGSRRQAFYTNLSPGHYTFHVIACNNDGIWSRDGASFQFSVAPSFAQSFAFKALCVLGGIGILWLAYWMRLKQVTRRVEDRMHERVEERARIARDLHDTFFQSVQGLFLRFHTATSQLRKDEPARGIFENALRQSDDVMREGRDLLLDLRGTAAEREDLPSLLAETGRQYQEVRPCEFKVIVNGEQRAIHSIVWQELSQITKEALGNAFRHSHARHIEVEINYEPNQLGLRIRDDGEGVDPGILEQGHRSGHWGLPGMRERAKRIGAHIDVWSQAGAGTEVELTIVSRLAYAAVGNTIPTNWFRRLWRRRKGRAEHPL